MGAATCSFGIESAPRNGPSKTAPCQCCRTFAWQAAASNGTPFWAQQPPRLSHQAAAKRAGKSSSETGVAGNSVVVSELPQAKNVQALSKPNTPAESQRIELDRVIVLAFDAEPSRVLPRLV